ncbi:MAG: substrate-binding domain-containing protein [Phycisphaeraceae bacterium JB051]
MTSSKSSTLTMTQLAKQIGVSRNVVSAVINNRSEKLGISTKTVEHVKAHIEKSGYVKSKFATALHGKTENKIVAIMTCGPVMRYPHLVKAMDYLMEHINADCGHVEILAIEPDKITQGLKELVSIETRKLIWIHASAPEYEISNVQKIMPLLKRMQKVVVYNFDFASKSWEKEYLDNGIHLVGADRAGCYDQVAKLFSDAGHTRIAMDEIYIDHPQHLGPNIPNLVAAFENKGFDIFGLKDPRYEDDPKVLTEHLIHLYQNQQVRCAFIRNDQRAGEVCSRLQSAGYRVPEDIAIIGFGDHALSGWLNPALTTFAFPIEQMCQKTIELLKDDTPQTAKRSYFNNTLILRKSHG